MTTAEMKTMIALVRHNLNLEKKIAEYEAEYALGRDLIEAALQKAKTLTT